ncbi:VirD4-like conjugal transfer protein, CD1115 family [uncultured Vagococcus sp.]|uniref:VirD4-like conjugal transfer protein, CD1115 family n=1 Tax=uncultured Vagococcus sp. TaxID=189676 RepID=UPI0025894757|nr:type IV secretory system conjugative DNA transfer family protein [uncultured Vagococcus sp.]
MVKIKKSKSNDWFQFKFVEKKISLFKQVYEDQKVIDDTSFLFKVKASSKAFLVTLKTSFSLKNKRLFKGTIEGQELPSEKSKTSKKVLYLSSFVSLFLFLSLMYLGSLGKGFFYEVSQRGFKETFDLTSWYQLSNVINYPLPFTVVLFIACLVLFLGNILYQTFSMRFRELNRGQKGDMKLLGIKDIQKNFKEIPHVKLRFDGYGGMPLSHYRAYFYIDIRTSNTVVIGISRSGKTEIYIFPLIDNLSRARKQASMMINDVKKEILKGTQLLLESRGYDTYSLDLIDPMRSMSIQLLQTVIFYWQIGEKDQAELLINSLTYTIYCKPTDTGTAKHFNETAQGVINAIILSFLETAEKEYSYEKVTMYNITQFIVEMGLERWKYARDPKEYNALDLYFEKLPEGSSAKAQYASTNFAGDREKGSIMSTAIRGLRIFQLKSIAKLTSQNTLDFKKLGFPKDIMIQFDKSLAYEKVTLQFKRGEKLLGESVIEPFISGMAMYFFDYDLRQGDSVLIRYPNVEKNNELIEATIEIDKIYQHDPIYEKDYRVDTTLTGQTDLIKDATMSYCDRPIAVYMCVADEDKSLHPIVSIVISQVYQQLIKLCAYADNGNKLFRRLHMILEEYGNMALIADMPNYVTASLGREILWNFFVQGYNQFYERHGKEQGKLILDNCQNTCYVMSKDKETVTSIYEFLGKKTIEEQSISDKANKIDASRQRRVEGEDLIQKTRIQTPLEGETIVIAGLNRKDNEGNPIRPFPIFNTKETTMPLRHGFELADYIDPDTPLSDLNTPCTHRYLDLSELAWDYNKIKAEIGVPFFDLEIEDTSFESVREETTNHQSFETKQEVLIEINNILWEEITDDSQREKFIHAIENSIFPTINSFLNQLKEREVVENLIQDYQLLS